MEKSIFNYAILDYLSGGDAGTAVSNVAQTTVRQTLGMTKDAYKNSYRPADTVTYIIQIVSNGAAPEALTVFDDLGTYTQNGISYTPLDYVSYLLYVGQERNEATGVTVQVQPTGDGVRFTFGNLPTAFTGMTLIVQARVNRYAPMDVQDGRIVNTAQLFVGQNAVASATATIEAERYADLRIVKSMTPDPISEGDALTYRFVICNYGTLAPTEVTLRDRFDPSPAIPLTVWVDGERVDRFDYNLSTGRFVLGSGAEDAFLLSVPPATFTRNGETGEIVVNPGMRTVTVSGVIRL